MFSLSNACSYWFLMLSLLMNFMVYLLFVDTLSPYYGENAFSKEEAPQAFLNTFSITFI